MVPDGIPVTFNTTRGNIDSPAYVMNGESDTVFNSSSAAGTATVTVSLDRQTLSETIVNIVGVYNQRTQETFNTIQDAIDDLTTSNGDIISVGGGTYTENIIITKKLTIKSAGQNIIIQALDILNPVITINANGYSTTIQGFTIIGMLNDTNSSGIFLDRTSNVIIIGNNITNNDNGIYAFNSSNNTISNNNFTNNGDYGIYGEYCNGDSIIANTISKNRPVGIGISIEKSNDNIINNTLNGYKIEISSIFSSNIITGNYILNSCSGICSTSSTDIITNNMITGVNNEFYDYKSGIELYTSHDVISGNIITNNSDGIYSEGMESRPNQNTIQSNILSNNSVSGICTYHESGIIEFNRIFGNGCGLENDAGNATATNNWWGSNNGPTISSTNSTDIYNIGGKVYYGPWLILSLTSSDIIVTHGNYTLAVVGDLTHNNLGVDTSSIGNIKNGIPITFSTDKGTINSTVSTSNGVATTILNSSFALGAANITATLDNQTVSMIHRVFNTIQAAINDNNTKDGDYIVVEDGTYTANIVVNKEIILKPINTGNVTIQPLNPTQPIITVTADYAVIKGFKIIGATNSSGIYINSTGCYILGNNLTNNRFGIYLNNSANCTLYKNNITNNSYDGIDIVNSTNNIIYSNEILNNTQNGVYINNNSLNTLIYGNNVLNNSQNGIYFNNSSNVFIDRNTISNNYNGIYSLNSLNSTIYGNNILNNNRDGVYFGNSSGNMTFNIITGNGRYGLEYVGNRAVNATNNWWGNNSPTISSGTPSSINSNSVNYSPWLVLNVSSSCDRSDRDGNTYNYIITADLTHNSSGADTSPSGSIPDGTIIHFFTTLGTINATASTSGGKATTKLNNTTSGNVNVSATLNNQTVNTTINVISVNELGIYNTRTGQGFTTIQAAVDSENTLNGDILTLANGTYTENVVVSKLITIKPVSGANVTVKPVDSSSPVFTIICYGSLQGLNINSGACGIYLEYAYNCNITGNIISNNDVGIYVYNSSGPNITGNTIQNNYYGIYLDTSNNTIITGNTIISNYYGIYTSSSNSTITNNTLKNSLVGLANVDSSNILNNNVIISNLIKDKLDVNTTGVVMADTYYNCGPAALATVLQNYCGISVSQDTLASFAGTDDSGTSMYGLSQAAIEEGLIAKGLELAVNQLEPGNIVYLVQNGVGHFSVITSITSTSVYLADSNLGNINMTLTEFTSYYSGYALIVTNDNGDSQLSMGRNLSTSEMRSLAGSDWIYFGNGSPWYFHVPENSIGRSNIHVTEGYTFTQTQYIDFYGTDYSTMYYSITAHYWGDYAGYLMKVTYNVYANGDWAGGIIYSGTQYVLLTHSANSQTISFTTPTMDGRSGDWVIGYMPLESLDILPTGYRKIIINRDINYEYINTLHEIGLEVVVHYPEVPYYIIQFILSHPYIPI